MKIKRRELIKGLGALGLGSVFSGITKVSYSSYENSDKHNSILPKLYQGSPIC